MRHPLSGHYLCGTIGLLCVALVGCSSRAPGELQVERIREFYHPSERQLPPDSVYGRTTWTHAPHPVAPKTQERAPLLRPTFAFDFSSGRTGEAVEALSQALGYGSQYPSHIATRPISIRMVGTTEEITSVLEREAQIIIELDHDARLMRVADKMPAKARLPQKTRSSRRY